MPRGLKFFNNTNYEPLPAKEAALSPALHFNASTAIRQRFSLPEPILHYIINNITSHELYWKLIKSCKWFFKNRPIIITRRLLCYPGIFRACIHKTGKSCCTDIDIARDFKLWPIGELSFFLTGADIPALICSKTYESHIQELNIYGAGIQLSDLKLLSQNVILADIESSRIMKSENDPAQLEEVIEAFPKLLKLYFWFDKSLDVVNPESLNIITSRQLLLRTRMVIFNGMRQKDFLNVFALRQFIIDHLGIISFIRFDANCNEVYKETLINIRDELKKNSDIYFPVIFTNL